MVERSDNILDYFGYPGISNASTENTNGRLEHLRDVALGFRNLANCTIRSLMHAGGFSNQQLNPFLV